jgi:hypothetical protein
MNERRVSRRQFLKVAGALSAVALYDRRHLALPALAETGDASQTWEFDGPFPRSGQFETPILSNGQPFTAIQVSWLANFASGQGLSPEVRVSDDGVTWSEWLHLHPDSHAETEDQSRGFALPMVYPGRFVQVRTGITSIAGLRHLRVTVRDTSQGDARALEQAGGLIDGLIIPRVGWGANEALRHVDEDPSKPLKWTPSVVPTEKVIVHHTVTGTDTVDPAAQVRAIYQYHAIDQGWGDIGYNYLIDWLGNVYEGRFGGPGVIGAHAARFNRGSIGIAFMGTFMTTSPTPAAMTAFDRLMALRASHIDVTKAATFAQLEGVPNLCGHQDVMMTACPGDALYQQLPEIRGRLAGTGPIFFPRPRVTGDIEVLDFSVSPAIAGPDETITVTVVLRNPSGSILQTQGPDPGYTYPEAQNYESAGFPKISNRYRWCVEFAGAGQVVNPYRWGLGKPMEPGETRELTGKIKLKGFGERVASVSVLQEYVQYYVEKAFPRHIQTVHPLTMPVPRSTEPGTLYFEETAHNVKEPFASYWLNRGGLARFGFPLTQAFNEMSAIDGNTYLTQYFERTRFEYHPEYAGTEYEVLLGLLGTERTRHRVSEAPFRPVSAGAVPGGGYYFPETGHTLHGNFLRFWEENGGLPIFGYPISERFEEISETDGKLHVVQYFERNRFEYHPDLPELPHGVLLGHLARETLLDRGWLPRPIFD